MKYATYDFVLEPPLGKHGDGNMKLAITTQIGVFRQTLHQYRPHFFLAHLMQRLDQHAAFMSRHASSQSGVTTNKITGKVTANLVEVLRAPVVVL